MLTHAWYPSTVCAKSRKTKQIIKAYFTQTATSDFVDFMLHDFGYRGATGDDAARLGGAAHLVNFKGTDTVPGMELLINHYDAELDGLAYSVPATEHSIMTSLGDCGEEEIVNNLLNYYKTGILSVVADSYDIYNFVENIVCKTFKDRILNRDGIFVIRPDSITPTHPTPEGEMLWIVEKLWELIGGTVNAKGFRVINPKVRVLWGDGICCLVVYRCGQSLLDCLVDFSRDLPLRLIPRYPNGLNRWHFTHEKIGSVGRLAEFYPQA